MFFRYANAITKADGTVSENEQRSLRDYKNLLFSYQLESEKGNQENIRVENNEEL